MKILSNVEFEELVKDQSPRLKYMAKVRRESDPYGSLTTTGLDEIIKACLYSGDKKTANWLKSLRVIGTNGNLKKLRYGTSDYEKHKISMHKKVSEGTLPFDLGDQIINKETGKRGTVVDYNPTTKNYIVVFNPFQVQELPTDELAKVGKKV